KLLRLSRRPAATGLVAPLSTFWLEEGSVLGDIGGDVESREGSVGDGLEDEHKVEITPDSDLTDSPHPPLHQNEPSTPSAQPMHSPSPNQNVESGTTKPVAAGRQERRKSFLLSIRRTVTTNPKYTIPGNKRKGSFFSGRSAPSTSTADNAQSTTTSPSNSISLISPSRLNLASRFSVTSTDTLHMVGLQVGGSRSGIGGGGGEGGVERGFGKGSKSWTLFLAVLNDAQCMESLKRFAVKDFCAENPLFLEQYRDLLGVVAEEYFGVSIVHAGATAEGASGVESAPSVHVPLVKMGIGFRSVARKVGASYGRASVTGGSVRGSVAGLSSTMGRVAIGGAASEVVTVTPVTAPTTPYGLEAVGSAAVIPPDGVPVPPIPAELIRASHETHRTKGSGGSYIAGNGAGAGGPPSIRTATTTSAGSTSHQSGRGSDVMERKTTDSQPLPISGPSNPNSNPNLTQQLTPAASTSISTNTKVSKGTAPRTGASNYKAPRVPSRLMPLYRQFYETFISEESPLQVNLPHSITQRIRRCFETDTRVPRGSRGVVPSSKASSAKTSAAAVAGKQLQTAPSSASGSVLTTKSLRSDEASSSRPKSEQTPTPAARGAAQTLPRSVESGATNTNATNVVPSSTGEGGAESKERGELRIVIPGVLGVYSSPANGAANVKGNGGGSGSGGEGTGKSSPSTHPIRLDIFDDAKDEVLKMLYLNTFPKFFAAEREGVMKPVVMEMLSRSR
ncbi:hypothetical protein HK102_009372, partial [Quaeritorhiza haematococci]